MPETSQFGLLDRVQVKPLLPFIGALFASPDRREAAGKIGRIGRLVPAEDGEHEYIVVLPKTGDEFRLTADDLDHPSPS